MIPVTLRVFTVMGQEIATVVDRVAEPGSHAIEFDARELPSGIYLYRLQAGSFVETRRMLLIR